MQMIICKKRHTNVTKGYEHIRYNTANVLNFHNLQWKNNLYVEAQIRETTDVKQRYHNLYANMSTQRNHRLDGHEMHCVSYFVRIAKLYSTCMEWKPDLHLISF